jgi:hypothetical protein
MWEPCRAGGDDGNTKMAGPKGAHGTNEIVEEEEEKECLLSLLSLYALWL